MNSLGTRISNRQFSQHLVRQIQQSPRIRSTATASTASSNEPEIRVPLRKERSATDILYALEKTITRDPTAAHYKYHDDPYLIPMSNVSKRTYALSKESGRKSAMWILKEHANLFQHKLADPEIPAFMPKAVYTDKEKVSEELLMNSIKLGGVTDSLTIYKLLDEDVSLECKQALLQLLCFHNAREQLDADLIEERWYRNAATRQPAIWKNSIAIDQLFEFLKKQDKLVSATAYNTMICGTAKWLQVEKAWALFEECESKSIPINLATYNSIIELIPLLRDGMPERRALLCDILGKINNSGLKPNVGTLNSSLKTVSMLNVHNVARTLTRSLFTDFKSLGVEPCLTSYYHALKVFHKDRGPRSALLREILDELSGKEFTMQDSNDTYFFVTAMEIARNHLRDPEVADKIHKLLLTGDNYRFIGESFKESIYYRHYMVLLLKSLPFEEFMKTYDLMVPHIYTPEPSVMEEIMDELCRVDVAIGQSTLPRLFSNMVMFDQLDRQVLISKTFNIMRTFCAPKPDSPVNTQFADAAWTLWTHVRDQNEIRIQKLTWTGILLADIAVLCLRGQEFNRFLTIATYMAKEQGSITGTADIEQLKEMFDACIERDHVTAALEVLRYVVESGFEEAVTMGTTIQSKFKLTATQEMQLSTLVGKNILESDASTGE